MVIGMLVGLGISLAVSVVLLLVLAVVSGRRHREDLADLGRMLPAMLGLLARLARDKDVPRAVRWRMGFAFAYNVQPFVNIIPDFVPVVGFADNVVVTCWALRSALRLSDHEAVVRNWRGSPTGLGALYSALRMPVEISTGSPTPSSEDRRPRQPGTAAVKMRRYGCAKR